MAIINKEYQDILGINPKYKSIIGSLGPKTDEAFTTIINLCANSIIHYDEIRARGFEGSYTFGILKRKDGLFTPQVFNVSTLTYYGKVKIAGATMMKLVNLGLLIKKSRCYEKVNVYSIPNDLFTTNDLSIKFYNPDISQF